MGAVLVLTLGGCGDNSVEQDFRGKLKEAGVKRVERVDCTGPRCKAKVVNNVDQRVYAQGELTTDGLNVQVLAPSDTRSIPYDALAEGVK